MLDKLVGGVAEFGRGRGGYEYEERKEFASHVESEGGYFDRQARYDHRMRLPGNNGRPPMSHMSVCEEEDSDVEEFFESSKSHHTSNNHLQHHQQSPHLNFIHLTTTERWVMDGRGSMKVHTTAGTG
ncbi:PREDICTED: uncharacterized protein LOC104750599 [Camelina sativa]|uniref:Uncharacterized protein LOC104750599 n=1 Tax=Camelina sativa TaxID=90675 RepID=A0ABM0WGE0_CAMSA|nr:PREDICTED: uncharacterized protein LOC104750599 [Camelina sativa]